MMQAAYMVSSDTLVVFFADREDADEYACSKGAADYMEVTEIFIIPSSRKDKED